MNRQLLETCRGFK